MLVKKVLDYGNYGTKDENRIKISMLTSTIGLVPNIVLCVIKFIVGLLSNSVSIMADSVNNLTDSISSIVTIVGAKISGRPEDKNHPYGYGRIEYISALIVSVFIIVTGIEFVRASISRILNPEEVVYSFWAVFLIILSMLVKFYMYCFYKNVAKKIDSIPIMAQSKDAIADVYITGVVVIGIFLNKIVSFPIDGYVGVIISLFIIYSGYELVSETISEIIGQKPLELVESIEKDILAFDKILGLHDTMITNFGPEKVFVQVDVQMHYDMSLFEAHEIIDEIERKIKEKYGINLSIHIDPIGKYTQEESLILESLREYMKSESRIWSFHDLAIVNGIVHVDVVVDGYSIKSEEQVQSLKIAIENYLKEIVDKEYSIKIDREF